MATTYKEVPVDSVMDLESMGITVWYDWEWTLPHSVSPRRGSWIRVRCGMLKSGASNPAWLSTLQ